MGFSMKGVKNKIKNYYVNNILVLFMQHFPSFVSQPLGSGFTPPVLCSCRSKY